MMMIMIRSTLNGILSPEGKRQHANPEEEAHQRKQQKGDIRKQKQQARLVHTSGQAPEATTRTNNENDNEPRQTALKLNDTKPARESDGAPTPRKKIKSGRKL